MVRPLRHLAFASLLGTLAGPLLAQDSVIPSLRDPAQPRAQVMILGVFHFHDPNADFAQFEGIDVLTAERQREIEAVTEQLAGFQPSKIAIERPTAEADALNTDYQRYRAGGFDLTRNEIHQLGFRLAARLDHAALYPVDVPLGMRMDTLMAYAREHDAAFVIRFTDYIGEIVELLDRMQREETIGANLRFMNDPANVVRAHEPYAVQATVGAADGHVGARVVADWYDRNLRIFANLAGRHTPILRHLVQTHPAMELVEAVDYLR
jgi:uncharacterized protein (DUF885 family)